MAADIHVLGLAGSLRSGSLNRALLRAAVDLKPGDMTIETFNLADVPFYNGDVEEAGVPAPVLRLRERIHAADALLIATPEYNYSVPAVLKNAIDWASRPPSQSCLNEKPVALMGATMGAHGTVRAQLHLRQSFVFTNSHVLLKPEVLVARAREKVDPQGRLTDEKTREQLQKMLVALAVWTRRLGGVRASG